LNLKSYFRVAFQDRVFKKIEIKHNVNKFTNKKYIVALINNDTFNKYFLLYIHLCQGTQKELLNKKIQNFYVPF